jgi:hypothetical protein
MVWGIGSWQVAVQDFMPICWPKASLKSVDAKDAKKNKERTQRKSGTTK